MTKSLYKNLTQTSFTMGRKSKAKKIVRELVDEKEKEEKTKKIRKKKSRKELKKEVLDSNEHKKAGKSSKKTKSHKKDNTKKKVKRIKINKRAIFGAVFAVIMIAILVSVGFLLFRKAFSAQSIAKLLPAENTIASLEININYDHSQSIKTFNLLENHKAYSKEQLEIAVIKQMGFPNSERSDSWLGRNAGATLLKSDEDQIFTLYFTEIFDKESAKKEVSLKKTETYQNQEIYKNEGPLFYVFLGDYLFTSEAEEAIKYLIDAQEDHKLYSSAGYRRIDDNLPFNRVAFLYLDFNNIDASVFSYFEFLGESGLSIDAIKPFLSFFNEEGVALIAMDQQFEIKTFLSLNAEHLDNGQYISSQENYSSELSKYIDENAYMFWGGKNLDSGMKRFVEIFADADPKAITAFENLLENYIHKYLGPEISFQEDVGPLFRNEYAFAIEGYEDINAYKILIELENPEEQALKIQEIADNFSTIGAIFEPRVVTHELEDGTKSKEIIAVPEEITRSQSEYQEKTIYELQMGNNDWGIYYAISGDLAIIATHPQAVKNALDLQKNGGKSLNSSTAFSEQIKPVLEFSDEITYFNFEKLLPILMDEESTPEILKIFGSLSSGSSFSDDGIGSVNYLRIK